MLALFNGTVADEREVLDLCLARLYVGAGQVVRSLTLGGFRGEADEGRMLPTYGTTLWASKKRL